MKPVIQLTYKRLIRRNNKLKKVGRIIKVIFKYGSYIDLDFNSPSYELYNKIDIL